VRSVFNFVTAVQDEVHRFTIGYSRQKHARTNFEMVITKAEGIGPKRAAALLKHFKTMKAIKAATEEELSKAPGMTISAAKSLREFLNSEE